MNLCMSITISINYKEVKLDTSRYTCYMILELS